MTCQREDTDKYEAAINGACAKRFNFVCYAKRGIYTVGNVGFDSSHQPERSVFSEQRMDYIRPIIWSISAIDHKEERARLIASIMKDLP